MQVENNGFFEIRESNFDAGLSNNSSNPVKENIKPELKTLQNENSYEEVSLDDFDDLIDNDFNENALCGASNADFAATLDKALDFVQNNMDLITEELDKIDASLKIQTPENKDETPSEPVITNIDILSILDITLPKKTPAIDEIQEPASEDDTVEDYRSEYDINKQIEASEQGVLGDCWLLAGLNSLSYSDEGRKIIGECIQNNGDGTYEISFKGVGISYEFTDEDLDIARGLGCYSTGDDDVLLMEIAVETFLKNLQKGNINNLPYDAPAFLYNEKGNPLNGGFPKDIVYLLTGKTMNYESCLDDNGEKMSGQGLEEFYNKLNSFYENFEHYPDSSTGCIHIAGINSKNSINAEDIFGNKVKLTNAGENHSWSIKNISDDKITMVNPWDSSSEVIILKDELQPYILGFDYLML